MFRFSRQTALLLCAIAFSFPATTAAEPFTSLREAPKMQRTTTQDVAVIVAVEDYLLLPDVPGAVDAALEWEVLLSDGLGVPNVFVLRNQEATRESMLKFAQTAAETVGEGGTIWWVFIGHGAPTTDGADGLFVGMDAQRTVESLAARGVEQGELLSRLQSSSHRTVVVADASFSGRAPDGEALAAGVQPVVALTSADYLLPKTVVVTAARPTELALQWPGSARPAFSYLFIGALRGWSDPDGNVTAADAVHYARRRMRKLPGQQTPQMLGDVGVPLIIGATEAEPAEEPVVNATGANTPTADVAPTDAALTLEYLQHRIVFSNKEPRQAGRVLDGPAFYHVIGRPDLAAKWKSHKPGMWITGIGVLVGSSLALGFGVGESQRIDSDGLFIAGGLVGGIGIITGSMLVLFGLSGESHPMSYSERRVAAAQFNEKLRKERGLGPEANWQDQSAGGPFRAAPAPALGQLGLRWEF